MSTPIYSETSSPIPLARYWRQRLTATLALFWYHSRALFGRQTLWAGLISLAATVALLLARLRQDQLRYAADAYPVLWWPLALFAIFASMGLLSRERELAHVELLLGAAGTGARLALGRLTVLWLWLLPLTLCAVGCAGLLIVRFPVGLMLLTLWPLLGIAATVALIAATYVTQGNAAGLCAVALLALWTRFGPEQSVINPLYNPLPSAEQARIAWGLFIANRIWVVLVWAILLRWLVYRLRQPRAWMG